MEDWRDTWRRGIVHQLPEKGLEALREALVSDDARLIQGVTCSPPPVQSVRDWPIESADAIVFCFWMDASADPNASDATVEEAEEFFAKVCYECDQILGEPAGCRWFLRPYDDSPRDEIFTALHAEVIRELVRRRTRTGIFAAAQKMLDGVLLLPLDMGKLLILADWLEERGEEAGYLRVWATEVQDDSVVSRDH